MNNPFTPFPTINSEKAITLALSLAQAENAIHAFTSGQVDAVLDSDGNTYLLRPAQEHLLEKERRLEAVMNAAADVITVVDIAGVVLSQSHAVRQVFGYEPEELVGSSIFDLIHEDDWPALHSALFGIVEGFRDNATVQFRHRTRDGSHRLIEATAGKLHSVSQASVVFSMRPVTKPRQGAQQQ